MFYTYILYSSSKDKFYIGSSQNPPERLKKHNNKNKGFTNQTHDWKTLITGQIQTGKISVGDKITFSYKEDVYELKVEFMEIFGQSPETKTAYASQYLGIHVSGVPKYYFYHGQELRKK